jgi:Mn-dependent DtxR family transcriptional regulator
MTEELTGVSTRSIWLTVLRGGGRWNVVEIAAELDGSTDLVCRFINQLSTRGYIRRHKAEGKLLEYSVDKTCKIPQSLTIGEVMNGATGQ